MSRYRKSSVDRITCLEYLSFCLYLHCSTSNHKRLHIGDFEREMRLIDKYEFLTPEIFNFISTWQPRAHRRKTITSSRRGADPEIRKRTLPPSEFWKKVKTKKQGFCRNLKCDSGRHSQHRSNALRVCSSLKKLSLFINNYWKVKLCRPPTFIHLHFICS